MLRIGQRWQPDPLLQRFAQAPVHILAVQSRAMASLRVLHEQRLRYICATVPHGHAYVPDPADPESIARTATGRVLYSTRRGGDVTLPECWSCREWRNLRESLRDPRATVIDHQDAVPACVARRRPCGGRTGPAPARSPSRSRQTTYPPAYRAWCPTPRAASAPPFSN